MYNPQIQTFIAVATFGSFSKAAETLYVSPTAVMKQMNTLEERLGITLLTRTNHGLELTEAGKSFLQDAKYIVDYSARAIEKAKSIEEKENVKSIRIGTSLMTPVKFLLDIWAQIQALTTRLKIELIPFENTPENAREILRNLGSQIDIVAGIYDERFRQEHGFAVQYLCDKKILVAVPLSNPLSEKEVLQPNDLIDSGILLVTKGWNEYVDRIRAALTELKVPIRDFDFFNMNVFNRAVKENMPIMAVDGWENIHPLLKMIPVAWNFDVPFGIMYSRSPNKTVMQFIQAVSRLSEVGSV